jgi:hypothetical protein
VEVVDVLGDNPNVCARQGSPGGEGMVAGVWCDRSHEVDPPEIPGVAQRLVASPRTRRGQLGGIEVFPETSLSVAEGRDTGLGGHAGTGEDGDP